ncbi:hypothetical protein C9374_009488 [Naegleria lovaniensis]|uniref:Uncharacterized protein n=1 Tax=Naegleria lovaniensis TaxID=51637 RepID=A0AA88H2X3_NAELO|nr:uncharacterized protein C9374_009488 [Naegleria lovaniensis]KAG2392911.1 hypothetical protein C9374_009488 [Naegleria lovaniensis]
MTSVKRKMKIASQCSILSFMKSVLYLWLAMAIMMMTIQKMPNVKSEMREISNIVESSSTYWNEEQMGVGEDDDFISCPVLSFEQFTNSSRDFTAECATVSVPFMENSTASSITLFVKRFRKIQSNPSKQKATLWWLPSLFGFSSQALTHWEFQILTFLKNQPDTLDFTIYALDHRGMGRSSRFTCLQTQSEAPSSDHGYLISDKEWPYCFKELKKKNLTEYSSDAAARDVIRVIARFLSKGYFDKFFLYGNGYGTNWMLKMLYALENHQWTSDASNLLNSISGIVLDQVMPLDYHFHSIDHYIQDYMKTFLKSCNQASITSQYDPTCSLKFKGQDVYEWMKNIFKKVYHVEFVDSTHENSPNGHENFNSENRMVLNSGGDDDHGDHDGNVSHDGPCGLIAAKVPFSLMNEMLGSFLLDPLRRNVVFGMLYRLERCNTEKDVHILYRMAQFYKKFKNEKISKMEKEPSMTSDALMYNLMFREFWKSDEVKNGEELVNFAEHSYLLNSLALKYFNVFNLTSRWGSLTSDTTPLFTNKKDIPILILHGEMDPFIPSTLAQKFNAQLSGVNHKLVLIPFSASSTMINSPVKNSNIHCSLQIMNSFLSANGNLNQLNTDCLNHLQFNFTGIPYINKEMIGTTDLYEGVYTFHAVPTSNVSSTTFIAVVSGLSVGYFVGLVIVVFVVVTMRMTCLNTESYRRLTH